ncbi:hypothetical protein KP509_16G011600 [Ceratopteris richardii]|uniref:Uncharacterized protein n=1 Tax=Ceratopteris richardii TaxID=49495 RepID=A0A8T2SWP3_CERRI|nr:hypothetical protein KP509_16G011600 [Ceratopteris richardii]
MREKGASEGYTYAGAGGVEFRAQELAHEANRRHRDQRKEKLGYSKRIMVDIL